MDLKGSLLDTNVHIRPSAKLIEYIKKLSHDEKFPENIAFVSAGKSNGVVKPSKAELEINRTVNIDESDLKLIRTLTKNVTNINNLSSIMDEPLEDMKKEEDEEQEKTSEEDKDEKVGDENNSSLLNIADLEWLYSYLNKERKTDRSTPYLHELLAGCGIVLPENAILKRNPDLEKRCVKLRSQQESREYRAMTKGVDNVRIRYPEDSISYQLKQLNRQLIVIGQFIISIFAGFLFGFTGIQLIVGNLDFGFRLLLGVMCALIIALAEIYFLAKKLNEELSIPETTQLGGPPKFAESGKKEHQD